MNLKRLQLRSLKTRLILITLAIFIAGIGSLAIYTSRLLREDIQRMLGEQQFATVSIVAAHVDTELAGRVRTLERYAARITPALMANPAAAQDFLVDRETLKGEFNAGAFITGTDGIAIASIPLSAERRGVNYLERDHVAAVLDEGRSRIGTPVVSKKLDTPVLGMAAPIRDAGGKVIGALVGVTDLAKPNFLDKITESRYGKTGGYLLVDRSHRLTVTATDKSRIMQPVPAPGINPLLDRYMQDYEGFGSIVDSRGDEVLSASKRIPAADWVLIARIPTKEAYEPVRAMQLNMLLAAIVLSLLAGGFSWWALRRQLAPMLATAKTLSSLAESPEALHPLPVARADEVGELITGFNHLLNIVALRETALRDSEERFRSLIEQTSEAIAVHRGGVLIYVNPAAINLIGATSAGQLLDRPVLDLIHPDFRELVQTRMKRVAEQGGATPMIEERFIKLDGTAIDAEVKSQSITFDGEPAIQVTIRDISARKQSENALRDSESKLRAIFKTMSEGVALNEIIYNANGEMVDYRILEVNEAFHSTADFAGQEIVGNVATRLYNMSPASIKLFWESHRNRNSVQHSEMRSPLSNKWFHVSTSPFIENRFVTSFFDITERKQAEEQRARLEAQLRESQKMEALGTLAGGVAHDFNNILAAITGNAELARQDVGPAHPALESLEEIRKASLRAKELVRQILTFGRRQTLERKVISLVPAIQEAAGLLRSTLPAGVSVSVEFDPDAPPVLADPTQVEQIMLNLCSNAWHAVQGQDKPGVIEVRLEADDRTETQLPETGFQLVSGELRPGRYACLSVRDNGSGMDKQTQARIFEPFFTTKPVGKGTGLGLAVVHSIVQQHGASIEVRSIPGEGTTFHICFPAAHEDIESAHVPRAPAAPARGRGEHILYVDDDEAIIFLMTRLLERQGYRVSAFTDANDAIAAVRANPDDFHLAVTDYNMPEMSGLEVARLLIAIRADLPVALASGHITEELRQQAPDAGICELIYKPNTVEEMCASVARLVEARGAGGAKASAIST